MPKKKQFGNKNNNKKKLFDGLQHGAEIARWYLDTQDSRKLVFSTNFDSGFQNIRH